MTKDHKLKDAVICAGGKGRRISEKYPDIPKALVPVFGTPIILNQIEKLVNQGITSFHFLLGYLNEQVKRAVLDFCAHNNYQVALHFHVEKDPLGSGGALLHFYDDLPDTFVLLYCDIYFDIDVQSFFLHHRGNHSDLTMFVHPNDHPYDSDLVRVEQDDRVAEVLAHPHTIDAFCGNLVNAAIYIVDRACLKSVSARDTKADFAQDVIPKLLNENKKIFSYRTPEFAKDMGTPDRLRKVELGYHSRFKREHGNAVIYLDRDGTINQIEDGKYITSPRQINLIQGAGEAIKIMRDKGYFIVIVTNQPVIARGDVSVETLGRIHARLEFLLGVDHAFVDHIYYCPHHPDSGFVGEVPSLKVDCKCRKPETGLYENASRYIPVDKMNSWMVGDSVADISAGERFGVKTAYVGTEHNEGIDADAVYQDILRFAQDLVDLKKYKYEAS